MKIRKGIGRSQMAPLFPKELRFRLKTEVSRKNCAFVNSGNLEDGACDMELRYMCMAKGNGLYTSSEAFPPCRNIKGFGKMRFIQKF